MLSFDEWCELLITQDESNEIEARKPRKLVADDVDTVAASQHLIK